MRSMVGGWDLHGLINTTSNNGVYMSSRKLSDDRNGFEEIEEIRIGAHTLIRFVASDIIGLTSISLAKLVNSSSAFTHECMKKYSQCLMKAEKLANGVPVRFTVLPESELSRVLGLICKNNRISEDRLEGCSKFLSAFERSNYSLVETLRSLEPTALTVVSPIEQWKDTQSEPFSFRLIANELSVDHDGTSRSTIRGAARIVDVHQSGLTRTLKTGDDQKASKLARMLMDEGFRGDDLLRFYQDGIPDTALVVIIKYYALYAGRYCTERSKAVLDSLLGTSLRSLIWEVTGFKLAPSKPEPILKISPSRDEAIAELEMMDRISEMMISAGIKPLLAKSHALTFVAKTHPTFATQFEWFKQLVPQHESMQSEDVWLNPTDIGKRMNPQMTPIAVNNLLISHGFQKRSDCEARYELTRKGMSYGAVTLNTAKHNAKTVQHIKWKSSIVELLMLPAPEQIEDIDLSVMPRLEDIMGHE